MKNTGIKYLLALALGSISLATAPECREHDKKIYKVCYSEALQNPVSADYVVYLYKNGIDRESMDFHGEKGISTADNEDFFGNVYDKGHMAPAETFSATREQMYQTFSYLNCALQHYKLNRGPWASLERKEREWSQEDSVIVHIDVVFGKPLKRTKGGAAIPEGFTKKILLKKAKKKYTFYFPNKAVSGKDIFSYLSK